MSRAQTVYVAGSGANRETQEGDPLLHSLPLLHQPWKVLHPGEEINHRTGQAQRHWRLDVADPYKDETSHWERNLDSARLYCVVVKELNESPRGENKGKGYNR
ncbi:hypothetical protein N7486_004158 [Penicillium sp. IBT 16267x]|nr:hypothetical protein N7486_004158 [Penicillium sp. IBT 16267x]